MKSNAYNATYNGVPENVRNPDTQGLNPAGCFKFQHSSACLTKYTFEQLENQGFSGVLLHATISKEYQVANIWNLKAYSLHLKIHALHFSDCRLMQPSARSGRSFNIRKPKICNIWVAFFSRTSVQRMRMPPLDT
ncbi:Hypothetical protein NTJ_12001 [Nesidiocoris tenuis]|uniref:Uncharacterized protein n=1 Tax=Nesidiocoris tenuis TaxID=355587 RepID=A0ABN7B5Q6_9HEMI|nr:Hypothetical protein NTJ_12001 [Nesidiocoris tenuis]